MNLIADTKSKLYLPPLAWWAREVVALAFWTYVGLKAFVFDVDLTVAQAIGPVAEAALRFRGLVLLVVIALAWLVLGSRRFWMFVGYVVTYPFVVVLWKVPKLVFRNWALAVAFIPAIHSVARTFRRSFILSVGVILAATCIQLSDTRAVLIGAMVYLGGYLVFHYARRFQSAFQRSTVFATAVGGVQAFHEHIMHNGLADYSRTTDAQRHEPLARVQTGYLTLSALRIAAEKLREVSASRKVDLYLTASLGFTVALTAVVFGLLYQGLYALDPASFSVVGELGFWKALAYSFSTLMTADLAAVVPASTAAQVLANAELLCSLLLFLLFVFVLLTSTRERYREDLDLMVGELRTASVLAAETFERDFEMKLQAAEALLIEAQPTIMKAIAKYDSHAAHLREHFPEGEG